MINKRNYGIDLLKIISMYMVIVLHVLGQGGILNSLDKLSLKGEMAWLLEILCYGSVNCYALISGYVGINSNPKYVNIIYLWLQALLYSALGLIVGTFFFNIPVSIKEIIMSFLPVMSGYYWYFTAYFALFFIIPVLNHLIKTVDKSTVKKSIFIILILFCVLGTIKENEYFGLNTGYSVLWLIILYCIGAYLKYYDVFKNKKISNLFIGYFVCCIIVFISHLLISVISFKLFGVVKFDTIFIKYTSIFILFGSICLMGTVSKLSFNRYIVNVIKTISPLTFGIYVIHLTPVIWKFLENRFISLVNYNGFFLIVSTLFNALIVFVICGLIDYVRLKIFNFLKFKNMCVFIDESIIQKNFAKLNI